MTNKLKTQENTTLFFQPAAYSAYQVTYRLLRTSVHLKIITDGQESCFHNQRQLYLARKLRSITEDTLNLIRGLAFLQDKRALSSPNTVKYTPPDKLFQQVYSSLGFSICSFALGARVSISLLK